MEHSARNQSLGHTRAALTVLAFFLLTTGLVFAVLVGIDAEVVPESAILLGLFGPALVAIAFTLADKTARVGDLLRQYVRIRCSAPVYLMALFTVPGLLLVTQLLASLSPALDYQPQYAFLSTAQLVFLPLISIGEELGWRGYLQPRLRQQYSLLVASTIVGITWAAWHFPGYYFNTGVVDGVSFLWFGLWVISAAVIMGCLYERSHSVFIAILFHTSANASFNMMLIMPAQAGTDALFKLLTVLAAIVAITLVSRTSALAQQWRPVTQQP